MLTPEPPPSICSHEPPEKRLFEFPKEASELLRSCVHCGLCLGACPTYREVGNENDSPRGRLYIMKALSEGRLEPVPEVTRHLDLCLDCRACETACPSGVQYGAILEPAREALLKANPPGALESLLRALFFKIIIPNPPVLSLVTKVLRFQQTSGLRSAAKKMGLMNLLPKRLREMEEMQPDLSAPAFLENAPDVFPAEGGKPKKRVAFFAGCVMDQFMGDIHRATIKVLQAHGVEVLAPKGQVCCGALMVHAGEADIARKLARKNLEIFRGLGVDAIVNNSAGCGAQLKDYRHLIHGDDEIVQFAGMIKDVSQVLYDLEPVRPIAPLEKTLCYDEPCHLLHAQKVSAQPKAIIQRIPKLKWIPLPDAEYCCGAAGIYNLTQPEMAGKVLARKIEAIAGTKAELVSTGNPGCLMQIRNGCKAAGLSCEVLHPMELLARQL
ncbi:MAG TPA: heterodisulfide reductase-related iron-sulfur binding cluster [Planctomycetota bacterium]|nr:heterodisulfide reductase-related iron-sulfur binding cluster [Planctomycetota bacterium]